MGREDVAAPADRAACGLSRARVVQEGYGGTGVDAGTLAHASYRSGGTGSRAGGPCHRRMQRPPIACLGATSSATSSHEAEEDYCDSGAGGGVRDGLRDGFSGVASSLSRELGARRLRSCWLRPLPGPEECIAEGRLVAGYLWAPS
jgi:hypothetical protein